jgi:hypothetical protein
VIARSKVDTTCEHSVHRAAAPTRRPPPLTCMSLLSPSLSKIDFDTSLLAPERTWRVPSKTLRGERRRPDTSFRAPPDSRRRRRRQRQRTRQRQPPSSLDARPQI